MPNDVSPQESLARYVLQRSHFRADGTIKHNALMPARDGKTSVFRVSGLTDSEIWNIGHDHVVPKRGKPLLGRAEIMAQHVFDSNLGVEADEPPPRHANITGWPEEQSECILLAQELAARAEFCRIVSSS